MSIRHAAIFAAAAVALGCAGQAYAQNLATNGSFEMPKQTKGGYQDIAVGSDLITGWKIVGTPGTFVTVVDQDFAGNPGYTFSAQSGTQWLDLAGFTDNAPNGVQQSIATAIGDTYRLNFYVGNITGGAFFGVGTTINVDFSSGGADTSCTNTTQSFTMDWSLCTQEFVATDALTTFTLWNGDPKSDFSSAIDNVSFERIAGALPPAVPEPSSWALMMIGIGAAGASLRRRPRRTMALAAARA